MGTATITASLAAKLLSRFGIRVFPPIKGAAQIAHPDCAIEPNAQFLTEGLMPVGSYSYTQSFDTGFERIGRYCSIGKGLMRLGDAHPVERISTSPIFYQKRRFEFFSDPALRDGVNLPPFDGRPDTVTVGNDVWIADDVRIKGGVHIGDGAVIAYGAVVTQDVPPFAVVGGVPAKVLRYRFPDELIARAQAAQWWRYRVEDIARFPTDNPEAFLNAFEKHAADLDVLPDSYRPFRDYVGALKNVDAAAEVAEKLAQGRAAKRSTK